MSSPTDPAPDPTPESSSPRRRFRIGRRGLVIGAVVLAAVVVVGVVIALLTPDHDHRRGPFAGPHGLPPRPVELLEYFEHAGPGPEWRIHGRGFPGWGPREWRGFGDGVVAGTVRSVSGDSITIAVDGGGERTLRTTERSRVIGDVDTALSDLQQGERVVVTVNGSGSGATARTIWSPRARVTGTVTALDGGRATVTGFDGVPVTVDISRLSEPPTTGDVVMITGTSADGGIRADWIRILPAAS